VVVFVCRDRGRARECAKGADPVLVACRAYAGEYPFDWEYTGRNAILFAAERDAHEGLLRAWGVPPLPPQVRVLEAHGDPRAGEAAAEPREILHGARDTDPSDASGRSPAARASPAGGLAGCEQTGAGRRAGESSACSGSIRGAAS
jgi:hypothetical protein